MKVTTENLTESLQLLKQKLHDGEVNFTYQKKDGSERTARGTLNVQVMGEENSPKGMDYNKNDDVTRYYDLNSNGWRSFTNVNLISIDDVRVQVEEEKSALTGYQGYLKQADDVTSLGPLESSLKYFAFASNRFMSL